MQNPDDVERQLIRDSKSDPQSFEAIYLKYYEPVLQFVYKRMENLEDCRDVTSSVFTKALANISTYKDIGLPFSNWLYRIAINEITQFYRDTKRMRVISIDDKGMHQLAAESSVHKDELISVLKKSLLYLSEEELLLIELRFFEERPFAEVGQILNIAEANAKVRTYRVIDKLKGIYTKIS